jgi:signal transduction histidine kinase
MLKNSDNIYLLVFLGMCGMFLLSGAIILFYVRYQKKFYRQQVQIKDTEMQYQVQILHSTIQSQEDERRRIGQDLHDEVGGALANLRLVISNIARAENLDALKPLVSNCQVLTDAVINNVRHISHNLSPSGLELFGFADILAELCDRTANSSGLLVILKNDTGKVTEQLDVNTSIALYRVVQELLTNTLKHAGAKEITITITQLNDQLIFDYADDGKGLDVEVIRNKGIGMFNIESRLSMVNATFAIGNAEKKGFNIHIEVPLKTDQTIAA